MKIKVLDHGSVTLRNISGPTRRPNSVFDADSTDPANTARISFDNIDSNRERRDDLKLCKYLIDNNHNTPIEMIEVWLEMKLPIFVARQFVRHRTCTINEVSGRYVTLPQEWYIPEVVGGKAVNKKQGQSDNIEQWQQSNFKEALNGACRNSYQLYLYYLSIGVAPEHARMFLHVNHYTHWVWKQDLHNMMHFLNLRRHSHAQIEAQIYAKAIYKLLHQAIPDIMDLFDET